MRDTLFQYFEWYLPADGSHWARLAGDAAHLKALGITKVWMPPACKATGPEDVGYGVYDLYDLGEFNQKGTVRTKYGTKEAYLAAVRSLKRQGVQPVADIVLNHKANADGRERFPVRRVDPANRDIFLSEPYEMEGWTLFRFPGRAGAYSDFVWHWYHFTGLDYDAGTGETGLYMIQGEGKGWTPDEEVSTELGNYDYLMFNDIDFRHPEVQAHLRAWAAWFLETTGVEGLRLDAVKHIDRRFMAAFIRYIRQELGKDLYVFGEYWDGEDEALEAYLGGTGFQFDVIDVPLHRNFYEAGQRGQGYDLRGIFANSLVARHPDFAVTFVDNHDTQHGQALESQVEAWFKPLAYALILLRRQGTPCVFYGDYYGGGLNGSLAPLAAVLDKLLQLRQTQLGGQCTDYLDHPNCIGWCYEGAEEAPRPLAVVLTNGGPGWKDMRVGAQCAGRRFVDFLGNCREEVEAGPDGWARFPAQGGSVSAWVLAETAGAGLQA